MTGPGVVPRPEMVCSCQTPPTVLQATLAPPADPGTRSCAQIVSPLTRPLPNVAPPGPLNGNHMPVFASASPTSRCDATTTDPAANVPWSSRRNGCVDPSSPTTLPP